MSKYKITNLTSTSIERGGMVFPPHKTIEIDIPSDYHLKHLSAASSLKVEKVVEKPYQPPVQQQKTHPVITNHPQAEKKSFPCPYCDKYTGKTEKGLNMHIKSMHGEK